MLLAPVLEPQAMESAISSVLDRLAPNGEVAHEEDIGEFAVLRNAREGRGRVATPIYDYGMVDDDFMLAPLAARWLLDDERGPRAGARIPGEPRTGRRAPRRRAGAQSRLGGRSARRRSPHDPRAAESRRHQAGPHDGQLARQRAGPGTRALRLRRECRAGSGGARGGRAARSKAVFSTTTSTPASARAAGAAPRSGRACGRRARRRCSRSNSRARSARRHRGSMPKEIGVDGERALRRTRRWRARHSTRCRWTSRAGRFRSCIRTRVSACCSREPAAG